MPTNEGTTDRIVRVVLAAVAVLAALLVGPTSLVGIVLFVLATILLVTAAVGFCPLYRILGLRTSKQ